MTQRFHVTYYYLATGMEGIADERDYGIVEAENADEARSIVAKQECRSVKDQQWMLSCLSAEPEFDARLEELRDKLAKLCAEYKRDRSFNDSWRKQLLQAMGKYLSDKTEAERLNALCAGRTLERVRYNDVGDSILSLDFTDGSTVALSALGGIEIDERGLT